MKKENFNTNLGSFIKSKRLKLDWSQSELAARLGNNFQNVSSLERGEFGVTLYWFIETLAPAFNISPSKLLMEFEKFQQNK